MTEPVAERCVAALVRTGATVATAESLTGGMVCAALTSVPGASAVVRGGVVAYDPQVKQEALGVPAELIARHGVVSAACAAAMADGARLRLGADWAVATTGVAGPDPSEGHPVGTVFVAVSSGGEHPGGVLALHLHGNRDEVRDATVTAILQALTRVVEGTSGLDDDPGPAAP